MLNYKNIFLSASLLLVTNLLFAGGGWPQPKNHGYFKLSQWWVISNQHFTDTGMIDPNVTTGTFNTSIYAEYGFTDRLTGIVYFPFFSRVYSNNIVSGTTGKIIVPGDAINSIGDTDISLKYGLIINKPVVLSATLSLGLPFGESAGGSQGNLQTGDGEFNQMLTFDAGTGFNIGKVSAYSNAYFGFNQRNGGYSDEWRFGIEAGATLFKNKITAIMRFMVFALYKMELETTMIMLEQVFSLTTVNIFQFPLKSLSISTKTGAPRLLMQMQYLVN